MGKSQSKIMQSLSVNLGSVLTKRSGDSTRQDQAELSLVKGRSTSLDSVSTAVSFGTGQEQPHPLTRARSCSIDDLQNADSSSNQRYAKRQTHTLVDGLRYVSVDSGSVVSSSPTLTEEEEGDFPPRGFTQSLPSEIERKISVETKAKSAPHFMKERDVDCFSDNFLLGADDQEGMGQATTASQEHREASQAMQEPSITLPDLPPSVLKKLSPQELSEFISFVCATLGHSLHEKLGLSAEESGQRVQTRSTGQTTTPMTGGKNYSSKHVKINDERSVSVKESHAHRRVQTDGQGCDDEDLWTNKHGGRNNRPCSLPSLHLRDDIARLQSTRLEQEQEATLEAKMGPQEIRSRSKSQDDCYHHDWCSPEHHHSGYRHHRCSHRSARRRRTGRTQRERGSRVDVSLDDNCPGLPQNRVTRRSRHHQQQQHTVCDQHAAGERGEDGGLHRKHRQRCVQSPTGEQVFADSQELNDSSGSRSGGEGEVRLNEHFVTLGDIKRATSDFPKGTNELDESVINDLKMQFLRGMEEQRKHNNKLVLRKGGQENLKLDAIQPSLSRNRPRMKSLQLGLSEGAWNQHQLAFPIEPRTGQDSPRTDMAVFNLDLNSAYMCQPIVVSDPSSIKDLPATVSGSCGHYLHKHHHVHHVIHHSQP